MPTFQNIKIAVSQAIDALESYYGASELRADPAWQSSSLCNPAVHKRLVSTLVLGGQFRNQPAAMEQARLIWSLSVCRKLPAVWFIRSHTAAKVVFETLCKQADIPVARILKGEFTHENFRHLLSVVARLSSSPLRICELSAPDQFNEAIEILAADKSFCYAVCDWELANEELALAEKFARTGELTFLCPN